MFGFFRKRKLSNIATSVVSLERERADHERLAKEIAMRDEQYEIQRILGFEDGDGTQNWLRLHQLLHDHEVRIKALEGRP